MQADLTESVVHRGDTSHVFIALRGIQRTVSGPFK